MAERRVRKIEPLGSNSINLPGISDSPVASEGFSESFNESNFIGAGMNNELTDSSKCSIINGSANYISGKYNCHIIGDYIGI